MNRLIPTPRTDKNGHVVVRHLKPEPAVSSRSLVPTVGTLMQQISARDFLIEHYRESGWGVSDEKVSEALKHLEEDSDDILPLLQKCLRTGSELAQAYASGYISSVLMNILDAKTHASYDPTWKMRCSSAWSPVLRSEISRKWHGINVVQDSEHQWDDPDEHADWIESTQSLIESDTESPKEDHYWRGMSALALVQLINDAEIFYNDSVRIAQIAGFVELAGSHHDLRQIMDIAVPRNLIDAEAIRTIMEQQSSGATAMGTGVL